VGGVSTKSFFFFFFLDKNCCIIQSKYHGLGLIQKLEPSVATVGNSVEMGESVREPTDCKVYNPLATNL
jgi:hypothetical protein